jgi:hypothetical protein
MNADVIALLEAARDRIASPAAWTQETNARRADGHSVYFESPDACCWCAQGALLLVTHHCPEVDSDDAWDALGVAMGGCISDFNDRESTRHADVIAAFNRAIAQLRGRLS